MKRNLVAIIAVVVLLGVLSPCAIADHRGDVVVLPSKPEGVRLAKLERIAILVNAISQGKSRLLLNSGVSATPSSGYAYKETDEIGEGCVTIYPLSSPLNTCLTFTHEMPVPMLLYGRILGVMSSMVPIKGPEDKKEAEPGTYLVFVPMGGFIHTERSLVSLSVDDEGKLVYRIAASTSEKIDIARAAAVAKEKTLVVTGTPDVQPKVTVLIDNTTANASISWDKEVYNFAFTVDYIYK